MLEIILASISFFSLLGIGVILFKKMSILLELPETNLPKWSIVAGLKEGVKKIPGAQKFDYELYLQKVISKVRVLNFKVEGKTGNWLERLRKRRNGNSHDDGYWEELKKAKDGK